ncbi:MAG TPA: S41 family peptidase [Candidatus Sulfotelmatobacter sp.]|nr:S41 family peptidase [Candidatus Sulfotelmatobacter sp.]
MPGNNARRSSPGRTSALAHQRGQALSDALHQLQSGVGKLTWGERLDILDAWVQVLDGAYAHLPLKRALYGFDPIRAIEHLRAQVPALTDMQFHRELTSLINRLRDAHTQYSGPHTLAGAVATLPFLVETYGAPDKCKYVVSKIGDRRLIDDGHIEPGVTLNWWNGVPFDRAVDLHADNETGGRPDARRARALESLTFRALEYGPPPDEHWVDIGYTDRKNKERELRLPWRVVLPNRAPTAGRGGAMRSRRGINLAGEAVRRAKKLLFSSALWEEEQAAADKPAARSAAEDFKDFLTSRVVSTRSGKFGYLRIWSFDVDDDQRFIQAAIELLNGLPDCGLIIDLRDNPGGFIWAAERMLQLFTPAQVAPTKFGLRATPLIRAMASARFNQTELGPWAESLENAPATGEPYSTHIPITSVEQCNDIGQHYGGPVVVVVDANTYSSGDLFAAGIADNRIGPIVCIGQATGAGGANVWTSDDLSAAMKPAGLPLPVLAHGANFTMALRRAVRSGEADGVLIEDSGIAGQTYSMTKRDIFDGNKDLIEHCAGILASQPVTRLTVARRDGKLTIATSGLDHIDVYADGHPAFAGVQQPHDGTLPLQLPPGTGEAEVVGFAGKVVHQRRRLPASE